MSKKCVLQVSITTFCISLINLDWLSDGNSHVVHCSDKRCYFCLPSSDSPQDKFLERYTKATVAKAKCLPYSERYFCQV